MDGLAEAIQGLIGGFYSALGGPGQSLKNLMHGTTVAGHPLHPALSDVPVGAWTVAVIADWLFVATGRIPPVAGDLALALGIAAALLAAASGYTDFHETYAQERRMAMTHGLLMTLIVVVMLLSLGMRLWGGHASRLPAIELSTLGWLMTLFGAYIGGHLTFGLGTVVNHNAFVDGPAEYTRVGAPSDFPEGKLVRIDAGGLPTLVVRVQGTLQAIGAVCSHAGGPLDEGKLDGDVVTCPWHGSRFCVADGRVKGGPATFNQPPLVVRERDGAVEVKLAHPLH
jgi:nitrite reductase/ring-hydroxylating ferredoxin subunit/uncharacterized membrane protein